MAKDKDNTKKKGRKSYLSDIQPNLAGEYVYTGDHWSYVPEGKSYRRAMAEIALLSLLSLVALIAAGFVRAGGMGNSFYVIIPYMAEAIAVFTLELATYKILVKGKKLRDYVYTASVPKLPIRALISAIFSALGTVCIIIFIIINGIDGSVGEIVVLFAAKAIAIVAPLSLRKLMSTLRWEKV